TERKFYGRLHRTTDSTEMKRSGIEGVAGGRYGVQITKDFRWRCASGKHPYPSRTRRLRLKRPMILCWRRHGKAGGCREPQKKSRGKGDEIERHHRRCNPHQRGSAVWIAGFTS